MDQIKYEAFICALKLGSLTRAGDALGYTQSGVSHLLNSLERECGMQLLHRDRSGVRLTSEGKVLLPYFESICAQQHGLDLMINELKGGESGLIRVAAPTSVAGQWLPYILKEFHAQYPKVRFELREVFTSHEISELVSKRVVDCGLFNSSILKKEYPLLHVDQLVAVLPPEHELANAPYFPMEALDAYPYIMLDESVDSIDSYSASVSQIFIDANKTPSVILHVINEYTALAMVAANQGYCILPRITEDRTKHTLIYMPLEKPSYRYMVLMVADERENVRIIRHFINEVQAWVRENYVNGAYGGMSGSASRCYH